MEAQLQWAGKEKRRVESQLASLKHELLSKESEGGRLQAELLALKREVKDEKACRSKAMAELQVELQESNFQVAQLEKSLRAKKVELEGVVTKSNRESTHHKAGIKQEKNQSRSCRMVRSLTRCRSGCWRRRETLRSTWTRMVSRY